MKTKTNSLFVRKVGKECVIVEKRRTVAGWAKEYRNNRHRLLTVPVTTTANVMIYRRSEPQNLTWCQFRLAEDTDEVDFTHNISKLFIFIAQLQAVPTSKGLKL